jgi:hypothetical protein
MAALVLRGQERFGWAGFAVFSILYLLVTVGNLFSDPFKESFPTTAALKHVQSLVSGPASTNAQQRRASLASRIQNLEDAPGNQKNPAMLQRYKVRLAALDQAIQEEQTARNYATRWRSWLPGAVRANDFILIGHRLFGLLSGSIGTMIGRTLYARRERRLRTLDERAGC